MGDRRRGIAAVVVTISGAVLVSCTGQPPDTDELTAQPRPQVSSPPVSEPPKSLLGLPSATADGPVECVEPVVSRKKYVPTVELRVFGSEGDVFRYQINKKDGSKVVGQSDAFTAGQSDVIFTTGVPNAEVRLVTISAHDRDGRDQACVISTIR